MVAPNPIVFSSFLVVIYHGQGYVKSDMMGLSIYHYATSVYAVYSPWGNALAQITIEAFFYCILHVFAQWDTELLTA